MKRISPFSLGPFMRDALLSLERSAFDARLNRVRSHVPRLRLQADGRSPNVGRPHWCNFNRFHGRTSAKPGESKESSKHVISLRILGASLVGLSGLMKRAWSVRLDKPRHRSTSTRPQPPEGSKSTDRRINSLCRYARIPRGRLLQVPSSSS